MDIYLQNTLSGEKEKFESIKTGEVGMYNCGPTVYNYAHIGNLRSYVFADTLRRMFEYNGYKVNQVINITDIGHLSSDNDDGEDKMTKALKREGKPLTLETMREVANFYFEEFKNDLNALNIETPEHFPFASDHIKEDIDLVQRLTDKGFTYPTSDGIYFDISKFKEYGKLGNIKLDNDELSVLGDYSRIGFHSEKRNIRDFAVWKFNAELGYDAPFGKGFPGWHIECSAMSIKYLGPEFDIHTGGIDHIPVHHNNEIAQSVCAGDPYAHYWMHNAHLNMGEAKMAKSGDNFITLHTLTEKNIDPLALRYVFLSAKYSSPLQFSWEALEGAGTSIKRLHNFFLFEDPFPTEEDDSSEFEYYKNTFWSYINDDLDTPKCIALVWDMIKDQKLSRENKQNLLLDFEPILGLGLKRQETFDVPEEIQTLKKERDDARTRGDYAKSDEIRSEIEKRGFKVQDTDSGSVIIR